MRGEYSSKRNFLFDLDGTLVDSSACHARAYVKALKVDHPEVAKTFIYAPFAGQPTRQVLAELGLAEPELSRLIEAKQNLFRAALVRGEVDVFPGAMALLEGLKRQGRRLFLVTGASRISAETMLETTKLGRFFEAIMTGDDGVAGKPSPEPYLRVLAQHHLKPEECIAIEDGESGIRSARAAGIDVVLIHAAADISGVARVRDCAELAELTLL
jgi:beta-phosphoglucomutase